MRSSEGRRGERAVVVTGASSGIGKAIALHLAQRGFLVFAGVRRPEDEAALTSAAGADGALVRPVTLDVTVEEQVCAVAETVGEHGTPLAGVVSNAGIAVAAPMEFVPLEDLRRQFEVNVVGAVATIQALMPQVRASRGRLVMIGSISGLVSSRVLGAYAASKFALEAISDALRRELADWGIPVSVVEPGRIATPIWSKSVGDALERLERMPPEALRYYEGMIDEVREGAKQAEVNGTPAAAVARAVYRALTDRRPRTRYFVGLDAHIVNALRRVLTDPMFDRLIRATRR
ncbi:MAG TPA: SDR family NAD(P)-dependent oxidoreductase [Trueperaceae bacterium]